MNADSPAIPSHAAPPAWARYFILFLLCLLSMITYLDRVCFGSAAPLLADELGLSGAADLKWAFTAFAIAYAIFEIPAGWLGDRWGAKRLLLRIVIWWSLFTAATSLIGWRIGEVVLGLGTLIVLRFLFGAGEAGAYPNIARALHNWFPAAKWAFAQGMVWMSGRLMGGLTPLIWAVLVGGTTFSHPWMSWRSAFILFGALGLLWALVFSVTFRNHPHEVRRAKQPIEPSRPIPWRSMLSNRSLLFLCLLYFCVNYCWYFNITYLPSYLADRFDVENTSIVGALYKGGPLWIGAVGCLTGGIVADWLGLHLHDRGRARRVLGMTSLSLCACCWLLAPFAPTALVFFLLASGAALCVDLTLGATWASCQDVGRHHPALATATMNTVGTLGAAAAGWITGSIVQSFTNPVLQESLTSSDLPQRLNEATIQGYHAAFVSYALAAALAAIGWMQVDPEEVLPAESAD